MTRTQRVLISLLIHSDAGVLLLLRGRPYAEFSGEDAETQPGVGLWELPGGSLEFGETPLQAGIREALEETGIQLNERDLRLTACCAYTLETVQRRSHRLHVIYEAHLGTLPEVRHSEEHSEHKWMLDFDGVKKLPMVAEIRDVLASCLPAQ
jgi:8-oxo-dGTP pyrophosphatase MutT (NUDIX family)